METAAQQARDVGALPSLSTDELTERWRVLKCRGEPPTLRRLLIRELAWRLQQQAHGGLDADTRRLLRSAIHRACKNTEPKPKPIRKITRCPRAQLPTGTKLVRTWRGRKHEVIVIDDGKSFKYRGNIYKSLTEIAERITGAHWSGPRFFGLNQVKGVS